MSGGVRIDGEALALHGAVTMLTAPALSALLDAQLSKSTLRRIDLSGVTELDSTVVALVLQAARAAGNSLPIVGAPPGFAKLAALYGVDTLLASS